MIKITAIVLNYNSSDDCEKCLRFLNNQDYENFDVIVVDNASTNMDETKNLRHLCQTYDAKIVLNAQNWGYSAGNNVGIKMALKSESDWCLIINPDVELRDVSYISTVVKILPSWPEAAVIGTNILLPTGVWQNPQRESTYWESVLWPVEIIKSKLDKKVNRYLCERITGYCEKVCGACFFVNTRVVEQLGFLDENTFLYSEEAILAAQIKNIGKKELYINEVTAYHEHYVEQKTNASNRMLKFLDSRMYYFEIYGELSKIKKKILKLSLTFEKVYWKLRSK